MSKHEEKTTTLKFCGPAVATVEAYRAILSKKRAGSSVSYTVALNELLVALSKRDLERLAR